MMQAAGCKLQDAGYRGLSWMIVGLLMLGAPAALAKQEDTSAADFLYRLAAEYQKAGRNDEAMHELHKVLLLNPDHQKAKRDLETLEQGKAKEQEQALEEARRREQQLTEAREQAMERAIQKAQPPPAPPSDAGQACAAQE